MERHPASATGWKGAEFRRRLVAIVRRRVPERDVEDIVQSTLVEALSPSAPTGEDALQRWLLGVARHKIADRHRRGCRESFDVPDVVVDAPPHAATDLLRWAERALPDDGEEPRRTLEWMVREGDGERLESIAESERLPAPRVRKRVSRLRRHLRAQWKKEVALLATLGVLALLAALAWRWPRAPIAKSTIAPVPSEAAPPLPRAPVPPAVPSSLPAVAPSSSFSPGPAPPTPPPTSSTTSSPPPMPLPTSSVPSSRGKHPGKTSGASSL
jgi:DNA-directed RNA polymerase specialized sigma24 family protein